MRGLDDTSIRTSPLTPGDPIGSWTLAEPVESRGDVHIHRASGDIPARVAVWRYQGSEPLPRFLDRLKHDGDRWRGLRHPNLMPTLETGRLPSAITCYWAQEEVVGTPLSERLSVHPLVAPEHALAIARQLGTALQVVHRAQLLHGDLDPANVVLVDAKDKPRLAWGGLAARLEAAGMDAGRRSGAELSPEVLAGRPATTASDTYGLCALLFRMMSGQSPWVVRRGGPPPGVTNDEPLPALPEWVSVEVRQILVDGLHREPSRRPPLQEIVDRIEDQELAARGSPTPLGTWSPNHAPAEASMTPPTVNRTVDPQTREDGDTLDSALANTPASAHQLQHAPMPPVPPAVRVSVVPRPPRAMAPPPDERSLVLPAGMIGGALLLGFALVAATVAWTGSSRAPVAPVVAPVPVAPAPPPSVVPEISPPPPTPGPAILTLRTMPPNAEVWEGDQFVGLTPLEVLMDPRRGVDARTFEFRLKGYATEAIDQPFSKLDLQHSVSLQKLPPEPKPEAASAAPAPTPKAKNLGGIKVER